MTREEAIKELEWDEHFEQNLKKKKHIPWQSKY